MEYVPGGTLESRLATGPLPLDRVLHLGTAIADALDNAHRHGVLHRDLKPGNVMLTADGQPKILDFGLALLLSGGKATGRMTQIGHRSSARCPYMAPEQLFGEADDVAHRRLRPRGHAVRDGHRTAALRQGRAPRR